MSKEAFEKVIPENSEIIDANASSAEMSKINWTRAEKNRMSRKLSKKETNNERTPILA